MPETKTMPSFLFRQLSLLILVLASTLPVLAQYSSGIQGTITDESGAVVPGAQVAITNQDTQVKQTAVANGEGFVQILHLPPGHYIATVVAQGFTTWQQTDINIEGTDVRTMYPKLSVGATQSTVEITANSAAVETTSGTISRVLEQQTVDNAPLVGENLYASVATLAPGVTGLGGSFGGASTGSQGTNSFNAEPGFQIIGAGQRQEANEYQVDGTSVNGNSRDGITNLTPEPDTVAQMKISTDIFSADKGRQSGALIEVFTKAGTNEFHGDISEFYTGSALTARTEFQTKVPRYLRNDFGGSVGGPIFKNKTFFFGSIFFSRSNQGVTLTQPVETPDFVNFVESNFPNSTAAAFFKAAPVGGVPTTGFQTVSQIEQSLISPYPVPTNIPGSLVAVGNVSINQSPINNGFQGHLRFDHNFHAGNDKLFYSLFRNTTQNGVANPRPNNAFVSPNATWYHRIDYVHTFSAKFLNEASVSYVRADGSQPVGPDGVANLPNAYPGGLGAGFSSWGPSGWVHNNWNWHDVITYVQGSHNIRIGIDVDRQQDLDNFTAGLDRPTFSFANIVDFATDRPYAQSGPIVNVAKGNTAQSLYSRVLMLQTAPFIQDDWKVNKKLALNIGLRWDYFGHLGTVTYGPNPLALFTPGSGTNPQDQIGNGFMAVRGSNGRVTNNALWRFAPRFGFAYDVFGDGTTSVHGGWGLFNNKIGDLSYADGLRTNPPQFANPNISIYNAGTTFSDFSYGSSPSGPTGFAPPPNISYTVDPHGGLVGTRIGVAGLESNLVPPEVQDWSVGIQRSVGRSVVLEADYFGTSSTHLYFQTDVNRYAGDLIQHNGSLSRLNASFGSVLYGQSIGIANAEVAALAISKRFSRGWSVHAIYNYGKALDYTSSNDNGVGGAENVIDANNPSRNYGRSDYDSRHRISIDGVWNIPGLKNGLPHFFTSGWTLSPVIVLQSGQPFTVYTSAPFPSGDFNADGYNYDVPNVPSFGSNKATHRSDFLTGVFPVSAFPLPPLGTQGNLGRNTYNGPGLANTNLAAERVFKIPYLGDRASFQLRGDILNLFNRVNFVNPVSDLSNGEFGKSTDQNLPRNIEVLGRIRF